MSLVHVKLYKTGNKNYQSNWTNEEETAEVAS